MYDFNLRSRRFEMFCWLNCFFATSPGINYLSIYTLSDLGVLSNLIGSLSLAN